MAAWLWPKTLATARYDGMPRSAIATGMVDYILSPEQMPEQLIKYIRHFSDPESETEKPALALKDDVLPTNFCFTAQPNQPRLCWL